MNLFPCHGCPFREGCQQREVFRSKTKGLGARVVKFACPILDREMRYGRRITMWCRFVSGDPSGDDSYGQSYWYGEVPATITGVYADYKFSSVIDQDALTPEQWDEVKEFAHSPHLVHVRRSATYRRIRQFLHEPDVPVDVVEAAILRAKEADRG